MLTRFQLRFLPFLILAFGILLNPWLFAAPGDECDTQCRERKIFITSGAGCYALEKPVCNRCVAGAFPGGCRSGDPVLPGTCSLEKDADGKDIFLKSIRVPMCTAKCFIVSGQKYVEADGEHTEPKENNGDRLWKCKVPAAP